MIRGAPASDMAGTPRRISDAVLKKGLLRRILCVLVVLSSVDGAFAAGPVYDLWIRNGTVIDGSGREGYRADVLVVGDTVAYIGAVAPAQVKARRMIDAEGRIVAPGFIDTHAHGDPLTRSFANFLAQGITTVVLGQDGFAADAWMQQGRGRSLDGWMRAVEEHGSEVNIATLSGHGTLRTMAGVGDAPIPTPEQMAAMLEMLDSDLAHGSFGLSFGLEYAPGRYSQPAEQKALGDLVGRRDGIVMSHMRSEDSDKIAGAIDELLRIDAHVHVSHLKIVSGKEAGEARAVLDQLQAARVGGRKVTGDVYPYLASASSLIFLYPEWARTREQYRDAVLNRRAELEAHMMRRVQERHGPEAILFTAGPNAGRTLSEVAQRAGQPYQRVMIDLIGYGGPPQAHFIMSPDVQDEFIRADHINICTDGAPDSAHPRSAGSFVKVLEQHVGDPPKLSLKRAIHKMSGLPAQTLGIDRGLLEVGRKADIVIILPDELDSRATYLEPALQPGGIDLVVVNGRVSFDRGTVGGRRNGRLLRRPGTDAAATGTR